MRSLIGVFVVRMQQKKELSRWGLADALWIIYRQAKVVRTMGKLMLYTHADA